MTDPNKQLTKLDGLKKMLEAPSVVEQFKNALADNAGPFIASVIDLYNNDTYLQNCEPKAVVMEALKAAILKLPIIKSLGFAWIVPYKKDNAQVPQFQIGYKGLIQLAMRTGQYKFINADAVYEGEYKKMNKLTGEFDLSGDRTSDKIVGYFAYIEMLNGFSKTLYATKENIVEHAKKYSKSYNNKNTPWHTEFDAMAKKTLLRGLLGTWGYLSVEMISAIADDERDEVGERVNEKIRQHANTQTIVAEDIPFTEEQTNGKEQPQPAAGPGF